LNFANSIQIFAISKLAKDHVTVVLTGEGADELFVDTGSSSNDAAIFGGYRVFSKSNLERIHLLGKHRLEKIVRFSKYSPDEAFLYNAGFLDKHFIQEMLPRYPF